MGSKMMHVRASVWLVFLLALGLAVTLPLVDLWYMSQQPVVTQVRLDARSVAVEAPVQLVVVVHDGSRTLVEHSPLIVRLVMADMLMGTQPEPVSLDPQARHYQAALRFSMPGTWHVQLHLSVPDHAAWSQELTVQVTDGGTALVASTSG